MTQPDRQGGRGHKLISPAVKLAAQEFGIPVYQPASLRTPDARQPLVDADAGVFVVAAYGLIFGEKTLSIPTSGCVNLHASLLPALRGANPVAAAIASGESETGVSLMVMERGLDSGPVISSRSTPIESSDTTERLTQRLAKIGADLLRDDLEPYLTGKLDPTPQPETGVTLARPMRKSDGEVDWRRSAGEIDQLVRAMWPWPRAWSRTGDTIIQIHAASPTNIRLDAAPGTIVINDRVLVACGEGSIALERVQFPGKAAVDAGSARRGGQLVDGSSFEPFDADREPLIAPITDDSATTA